MDEPRIRIAVPTHHGELCMHFGHCELFAVIDIDPQTCEIIASRTLTPPEHEPGVLPRWIKGLGVDAVIAGGMGSRARSLFAQEGIEVVVGAHAEDPENIARDFVRGKLSVGENVCDH